MNKILKILLLGLIIWAIPFLSSFFVWDMATNAPRVSVGWFNALMAFTGAIGFAIAAGVYFSNIKKDSVKEGWTAGILWYVELLVLDLIFLVGLFQMQIANYFSMLLTYLNVWVISVAIGYIKK